MEQLDIVKLIEDNPITKLSIDYNVKLLIKIKEYFTDFEQQLFLSSFYCYLKYDITKDFIIDLDNIWKWLGFNQKYNAERLLEKNFILNKDYIKYSNTEESPNLLLLHKEEQKGRGGHNIKKILLNINSFKKFCLKAGTKKADEIHNYYIKLEQILQETINDECNELKLQLYQKDNIINKKQKEVEQAIINQFPVNTECIYFGTIDNLNENGEKLIKFGHTNDLSNRVSYHHKHYDNFTLQNAFKVQNKVEIENLMKNHPKIKPQIRTIKINNKNKTEIISYDNVTFSIDKLTKIIKEIIQTKIYSVENFSKLTKRNEVLENENKLLNDKIINIDKLCLEKSLKINELNEKLENYQKIIETVNDENKSVYQNILLPEDEINKKFNEFVNQICMVRPDVEELSVNIEGRYRLWSQTKPTKEMFHSLKNYLDTRFKPKRIGGNHGYTGLKLKSAEYKKSAPESAAETFIFQACQFSDCGKILNSVLLSEYQKWKASVGKEICDNDMKEIKGYLNDCPYALKATVWTDGGSNEGYYGLSLKNNEKKQTMISSTGKKVFKRENFTNQLLATWDTIAKAANDEGISTAKMSRAVKNKTIIEDYFYSNQ
jgi:hypothetical protein